jgi:hypothetical protein
MSWLGTVSEGDGYIRSVNRVSREVTTYVGGTPAAVTQQYALSTTWFWGGMTQAAAASWLGTLGSASPKYTELGADRVDESGQYAVTAVRLGTWGA